MEHGGVVIKDSWKRQKKLDTCSDASDDIDRPAGGGGWYTEEGSCRQHTNQNNKQEAHTTIKETGSIDVGDSLGIEWWQSTTLVRVYIGTDFYI